MRPPRSAKPACWFPTSNSRRPKTLHRKARLHDGSLIPLTSGGGYPTTEQTLAAISLLLNGGGLGNVQDITAAFSQAFTGREADLRNLIDQLNIFIANTNDQKDDIVTRRWPQRSGRAGRRAETGGGQGAQDGARRVGGAQGSAQPAHNRGGDPAGQIQCAGGGFGQPDP